MFQDISKADKKLTKPQIATISWWLKVSKWVGNVPTIPNWQITRSTKQTRKSLYRRGIINENNRINPVIEDQIPTWAEQKKDFENLQAEYQRVNGDSDRAERIVRERAQEFSTLPELGVVQFHKISQHSLKVSFSSVYEVWLEVNLLTDTHQLRFFGHTMESASPDPIQALALATHQLGALLEHCLKDE